MLINPFPTPELSREWGLLSAPTDRDRTVQENTTAELLQWLGATPTGPLEAAQGARRCIARDRSRAVGLMELTSGWLRSG